MTRFYWFFAPLLGGVALLLAACGGSDGDARSQAGLEAAVRRFGDAIFEGDYKKAYDALAKKCREQSTFEEFRQELALGVTFLQALGVKFEDFEIDKVEIRDYTPDGADVGVTIKVPKAVEGLGFESETPDFSRWSWEDGRWVTADCQGLLGGDDGDAASAPTVPPAGSGPKLGEPVAVGDARVTVHAREDPARVANTQPEAGKRYVAFEVTVEAADDSVSVSGFDFTVQDDAGFVYEVDFFAREPALKMVDLARGRQVRGWVTFQVPVNARLVALYADLDFPNPEVMVLDVTR